MLVGDTVALVINDAEVMPFLTVHRNTRKSAVQEPFPPGAPQSTPAGL